MILRLVLAACAAAQFVAANAMASGPAAAHEAVAWFTDAVIAESVRMDAPKDAPATAKGTVGAGVVLTKAVAFDCPVLSQQRGIITFWIKPNWDGNDGKTHRILRIGDPETNGILVEKSDQGLLRFVVASPKKVSAARADVSGWKAGEWHQVAVVWMDFRDKPLGLPIWIDRKIAAGPCAADNAFPDFAAMADARLVLGDETTDATIDELIVRNTFSDEISGEQIELVYRDYFRTAPYDQIRIDPEPLRVPSDRRVVAGHPKQFGLEGCLSGVFEDMTDFVAGYHNWGHFDAKPLITWTTSDPAVATVDENGLVTGHAVGRCTLTAEFRGLKATYRLDVIPVEQPDLDLAWVERLPRYDWAARKNEPVAGDAVQSVAHIFNMGYEAAPEGAVVTLELLPERNGNYELDRNEQRPLLTQTKVLGALAPKEKAVVTFDWTWPAEPVWVRVTVDPRDRISEICEANNAVSDLNTARPVLWGHEPDEVNRFHDDRIMTLVGSFSVYDSNQAHIARLNCMLREAVFPVTSPYGVKYSVRLDSNIWRGDFLAGDRWGPYADRKLEDRFNQKYWRGSWPHDKIEHPLALESGVMHELGHTVLALPDLYGAPLDQRHFFLRDEDGEPYEGSEVFPYIANHNIMPHSDSAGFVACGQGYSVLMDACHMWLDESNAGKIQYYADVAERPFWGSQGPLVPQWSNRLYVTDVHDRPLVGASLFIYQNQNPPMGELGLQYFYDLPKFIGRTNDQGRFLFPKQTHWGWDDPDTDQVDGRVDISNPFGRPSYPVAPTPNCFGMDSLLIKVVAGDQVEFHYLTLPEANVAYFENPVEAEYPIRTSLKPAEGERTPLADRGRGRGRGWGRGAERETNLRPVAVVAERALTVKVGEEFTLDGSQSHDPEGKPLVLYEWQRRDGDCEPWRGSGATITAKAGKPGQVRYAFHVNDGVRASEPVEVTITVVAADGSEENAEDVTE
ncbi:MAG: Ig-like domain-containing protein [Verrucomicrobia bacterium]|nr:Ig-like domain-containing protein [Verrucomicrobiota bacterium]